MFGPIYLSLAEMASMAPIAGAQYHWGNYTCNKDVRSFELTSLQSQSLLRTTASGFLVISLGT